jgi:hypothetical protein
MDKIIDAVMLNMEYEAGVEVHQGRELNMPELPATRDEMLKTNHKGKHDKNVNVNNGMDENNTAAPIKNLQLYNDSYYQYSTSKQVADVLTKEASCNLVERIKQSKVWWRN